MQSEWVETLCLDVAAAAQRHPRHHQVAERRRRVWVGVVTGTRKTHIITCLWTCLDVLSQPRGYYDAFATAQGRLLCGERVAASPGRHCPGRILLRLPRHHHAAGRRCSLAIIAAGLGSGGKLTRHVVVSDLLSLCLSQQPQVGRWFCTRAGLLGHPCCKSECCLQDMIVCAFSTGDGSVPPGGTAAAAPGLLRLGCSRSAWCTHSLQDTSHNFTHFLVSFRSVTPCCLCCFDLGTLEQSRGPFLFAFGRRFCEFATTLPCARKNHLI